MIRSPMHTMRQMNSMMNTMFSDPFDMMGQNALVPRYGRGFNDMPVSLFDSHFGRSYDFNNMAASNGGNCHSFMSQSVMTMSSGPDGRPQVYQETMSTRMAPGGIKETKKTVSDSRTGTRKMAIGHHIGERAHILERERNVQGDEEEHQEFINLEEEEAESFNREWETRTRRVAGNAIANTNVASNVRANPAPRQLALPSTTDIPASRHSNRRWFPSARRAVRSLNPLKVKSTHPSSSFKSREPATSSRAEASSTSPYTSGSRKREHKPDRQVSNKRHAAPASDN
ncbi:Myeloid leukemia factor [Cyphomyrmex costatus]|uniref:Myeloid leukemia factor n=1 Tax=Cyphomyrmex costatus TaxID=456900 RepID=A0A195CGB2_9HYME|nr:Myeloid leukemia factor [Cyphomyrmex costatus]